MSPIQEFEIGGQGPGPGSPGRKTSWIIFAPGLAMCALGALIIANPELLIWIVGGGCLFVGFVLLSIALRIRAGGGIASLFTQRPRGPFGPFGG